MMTKKKKEPLTKSKKQVKKAGKIAPQVKQ